MLGVDGVFRRAEDEAALRQALGKMEAVIPGDENLRQGRAANGRTSDDEANKWRLGGSVTADPKMLVENMSYKEKVEEGIDDMRQGARFDKVFSARGLANECLEAAERYARMKRLDSVVDNEADAYRHFTWNAKMTQQLGWEQADIIASNHEQFDWIKNHGAKFNENGVATFEIPLASLMDIHNNDVGRRMAISKENINANPELLFQTALKNGNIITKLDQVPGFLGFESGLVYTKRIDGEEVPVVKVTYDKNARTFIFHPRD